MSAVIESDVLTRAAVFQGPQRISAVAVPLPQEGEHQVRVKLQGCGVCASNLPVWEGRPWFQYPFPAGAPGHEGWGIIEAVGAKVRDLKVGDRVAMVSGNAYAERDVADEGSVVKIPASLADQPLPGEPLGCAVNIFNRSDIQPGQTVGIIGIGFLGALLTSLCVRAGARVVALSRRSCALEMAEHYGASAMIQTDDTNKAIQQARRSIKDAGCDRVIEVVGNQEALDLASGLVGVRARLVIGGYHQDGNRSINMQHWNWLGLDVINAHERAPEQYAAGIREAIALIAADQLDPTPLYTHRFSLGETDAAFHTLSERPQGFFKALIECE
jgi:threonine dehydrogenase-like Zn-dependent dehydrogenase